MKQNHYLGQNQAQKAVMAPYLRQSVHLLSLSSIELDDAVQAEVEDNPLLEADRPSGEYDNISFEEILDRQLPHMPPSFSDDPEEGGTIGISPETFDLPIPQSETLADHLLSQLRLEDFSAEEMRIGEYIISHLDEDGFFKECFDETAARCGVRDPGLVEAVLTRIHQFDPPGIATHGVRECLLAQLPNLANGKTRIIGRLLNECFPDVLNKRFSRIAKKLKINEDKVREYISLLSRLDPKPARHFASYENPVTVKPDIFVERDYSGRYVIASRGWKGPRLRVSRSYQLLMKKPNLTPEERAFLNEKFSKAMAFMKSIEQRRTTIMSVAATIVDNQQAFFRHGASRLVPMSITDMASWIGRDPSTVSRAIRNKYLMCDQGLLPLKYFFSRPSGVSQRNDVSSAGEPVHGTQQSVKDEILFLVRQEDKNEPLSDTRLVKLLEKKGIRIARRTAAKYRGQLNIPSARLRKH